MKQPFIISVLAIVSGTLLVSLNHNLSGGLTLAFGLLYGVISIDTYKDRDD